MIKQYTQKELGKKLTNSESVTLMLEKKYMDKLYNFFRAKEFLLNLYQVEKRIKEEYEIIKNNTEKSNIIEIALERVIRFHVYRNFKGIKKIYPSPISCDIAFETNDVILHIDSKTLSKQGNPGDWKYCQYNPNQSSFDGERLAANDIFKGIPIKASLPKIDPQSKKPVLTYFLCLHYIDDEKGFKYFEGKVQKNMYKNLSLTCLPNGILSPLFKNKLVFGLKTYHYLTDHSESGYEKIFIGKKQKDINLNQQKKWGNDFTKFEKELEKLNFKVPNGWSLHSEKIYTKFAYLDEKNDDICWVVSSIGQKKDKWEFKPLVSTSSARVLLSDIKIRYDYQDNVWEGYKQWNIKPEIQSDLF